MKRLIASLFILICLTSLALTQEMSQQKGEQQKDMMSKGKMMGMEKGMRDHMMYSMMVHHVLMKANTLDLTDTQKQDLANIREKYLYPTVRKEADFKISHMKTMDMLHDPNFDPANLK